MPQQRGLLTGATDQWLRITEWLLGAGPVLTESGAQESRYPGTAMTGRLGSWDFKEKPTGLWKRVLHAPRYLFRWKLGWLMGERFLMITHVGRRSAREYQTVVEVVEHDSDTGEYIVCSGTGPGADWYRNIRAVPAAQVQVRNRKWRPAQRCLDQDEAARRFVRYEQRHAKAAERLLSSMGNSYDGTDAGRLAMMAEMPMVAFGEPTTS